MLLFAGIGCSGPKTPPPFDVPALVGLDLKGVAAQLGPPATPLVPDLDNPGLASAARAGTLKTWDVEWKRGGKSLSIEYDLRTLKIVDFFIAADDPSGATSDLVRLRFIGNLTEKPARYSLIPVPAMGHPGQFTGLKIVPR